MRRNFTMLEQDQTEPIPTESRAGHASLGVVRSEIDYRSLSIFCQL
jgi:hypothetical protein